MNAFVSINNYINLENFGNTFSNKKISNKTNLVFFSIKNNQKKMNFIKMQEKKNDDSNKEDSVFFEKQATVLDFFQEVKDEIKMIEWPTVDRVLKQFVIVVISLVFSALFIFSIDGLFAAGNKILFEGNF